MASCWGKANSVGAPHGVGRGGTAVERKEGICGGLHTGAVESPCTYIEILWKLSCPHLMFLSTTHPLLTCTNSLHIKAYKGSSYVHLQGIKWLHEMHTAIWYCLIHTLCVSMEYYINARIEWKVHGRNHDIDPHMHWESSHQIMHH